MILQINRKDYEVPDDVDMTALAMRQLADVPYNYDVWEIRPGRCDQKVEEPMSYTMPKGCMRRFFTAPSHINNSLCAMCCGLQKVEV